MRIKVDLSEFIEDERKFAVVNVNLKESRTVRDVLSRIKTLFNVSTGGEAADGGLEKKPTLGLFEEEFYIHPDETSTVLQDTGVIKLKSLPRPGGSEADGRKKKKGKKWTSEEEHPHSDGDRKERKSIRGKTEEEIQSSVKEEKKEKRSKVSDEFTIVDNEDDDKRKVRKRKRYKTSEEPTELELDLDEAKEQRKFKKSRIIEERFEPVSEVQVKEKGKWKKGKFTEKTAEPKENIEEVKEKKKSKKEKTIEDAVESEGEVQVLVKEKKKRKKEKNTEPNSAEIVVKDVKKKKSRSAEQSLVLETKVDKRKMLKNSVEDDETLPILEAEKKKSKWLEEKSSQEKVVSTSTVINLESEETSGDEDSTDASRKSEKQGNFNTRYSDQEGGSYAADSVTDPLITHDFGQFSNPGNKKRKRKHSKKRSKQKQEDNEKSASTIRYSPSEEKLRTPVFSMNADSKYNLPYSTSWNKRPLLNSNFTQRKHIHFTSDDEKEVTSAIKGDMEESAHEIEIVETTTRVPRKNEVRSDIIGQNPKHRITGGVRNMSSTFFKHSQSSQDSPSYMFKSGKEGNIYHSTPLQKKVPVVVEVEGEGTSSANHAEYAMYNVSGRSPLHRNKGSSFDELATLRRICENKTLTVCKVDSRNDQAKAKPKEIPTSSPVSPYLRPPSPLFTSPREFREETKQSYHNFMAIRNRTVPLVFSNTRKVQRDSSTDSIREKQVPDYFSNDKHKALFNNSYSAATRSTGGQDMPFRAPLNTSLCKSDCGDIYLNHSERVKGNKELDQTPCQSKNENSCDPSSLPSTSKWVRVADDAPKERVGMVSQPRRRDKPRVFQSIGAVLSNMRNQVDSSNDTGELLVLSNDEAEATPHDETGSEAIFNKESNSEKMTKSQINGKSFMTSNAKIDNEVVDLESEEENELPVINSVVTGMGSGAVIIEHLESEANFTDKIIANCRKTASSDTKIAENKKTDSFAPGMKAENRKTARFDAEIIEDKRTSDYAAEIIEDSKDAASCDAEIVEDRRRTVSFAAEIVENIVKSTESTSENVDEEMVDLYADIIEDDQEGMDFDAEIVEDEEEEVEEEEEEEYAEEEEKEVADITKMQKYSEKKTNAPVATVAAVHEVEDAPNYLEEIVTEGLKKDLAKEVRENTQKGGDQAKEIDEAYFEKFPAMKVPPKVGEFIAVKKLSLDECYCPVYSRYIQAYVIDVDGLKVTLKYVDKIKSKRESDVDKSKEEVEEVDLTFEEDEVDLTEDEQDRDAVVEELDWRDLYEPRLIFP